jgi:hypothetical protein
MPARVTSGGISLLPGAATRPPPALAPLEGPTGENKFRSVAAGGSVPIDRRASLHFGTDIRKYWRHMRS